MCVLVCTRVLEEARDERDELWAHGVCVVQGKYELMREILNLYHNADLLCFAHVCWVDSNEERSCYVHVGYLSRGLLPLLNRHVTSPRVNTRVRMTVDIGRSFGSFHSHVFLGLTVFQLGDLHVLDIYAKKFPEAMNVPCHIIVRCTYKYLYMYVYTSQAKHHTHTSQR